MEFTGFVFRHRRLLGKPPPVEGAHPPMLHRCVNLGFHAKTRRVAI